MEDNKELMKKKVETLLEGRDPMKRIVNIECGYGDDKVSVIYIDDNGNKRIMREDFRPFLWAKTSVCSRMLFGDRTKLREMLKKWGIRCVGLRTWDDNGNSPKRMLEGFRVMFQAERCMSYNQFLRFFNAVGTPVFDKKKNKSLADSEFITISPVEQYMIYTGKRLFKGYENYDDLNRMVFDLETQGLVPERHRINQIGVRTNRGFEKIISVDCKCSEEEADRNELLAICDFLQIISELKPDIIAGHNSENFDFPFLMKRCEMIGTRYKIKSRMIIPRGGDIDEFDEMKDGSMPLTFRGLSKIKTGQEIYKASKPSILKLGGEVENYVPTIMWGYTILDSLHAVRRAQAQDSSFKKNNLKYATKYLELVKPNRVYVPGSQIRSTWEDTEYNYAFNDKNGQWMRFTDKDGNPKDGWFIGGKNPNKVGRKNNDGEWDVYDITNGKYIVERYLLDDLYETDKVELKMNESNFLIAKMLPTTFKRACTMGTAGIWKLIMMAWSFENGLAIPQYDKKRRFTGGLSRLLCVGYVGRQMKFDFNSLYPSIMLTWKIESCVDVTHAITHMLDHVLTMREYYKGKKKAAGKICDQKKAELAAYLESGGTDQDVIMQFKAEIQKWAEEKSANDKKQLPLKILGNSVFGSFGGVVFPWCDMEAAENVTCIGRQSLRLLVKFFGDRGYRAIVGDSFIGKTQFYVQFDDIPNKTFKMSVADMFNDNMSYTDVLGREYDASKKKFRVMNGNGEWVRPKYIYRHKTDKDIYEVSNGKGSVKVTEDHSLIGVDGSKINPKVLAMWNNRRKIKTRKIKFNG